MPTIKTDGPYKAKLNVVDLGDGQPVVLIHGWPLSHRMWEGQMSALLDAGYRVVAYDRRGFGESSKPAGGYDYDTFAADLATIMDELELSDAVLVGFSMGGGEVARYIGHYGTKRVAKAALLGAVPPFLMKTDDNPDGADPALFEGMLADVKADRIGFLAEFFPNFFNLAPGEGGDTIPFAKSVAWVASPLATQACIVAFGTTDFRQDLARFDVPTLIVHGDADRIVPLEISGGKSHAMIPGSRLEVIRGAPHGFSATHGKELNEILLDFLRG